MIGRQGLLALAMLAPTAAAAQYGGPPIRRRDPIRLPDARLLVRLRPAGRPDVRERDAMPLQTRWATRSGGGSSRVRLGPAAGPLPRPHADPVPRNPYPPIPESPRARSAPPPRPRARTIATVASATARVRSRALCGRRVGGRDKPPDTCAPAGGATHPRRVRSRGGRVGGTFGKPA